MLKCVVFLFKKDSIKKRAAPEGAAHAVYQLSDKSILCHLHWNSIHIES